MTADAVTREAFADGTQGAGRRDVRRRRHRTSSSRARRSSVQPGGQFEIPGIGYGAVDERRVVRSGRRLPRLRGRRCTSTSASDWHDLPAGTEILLGYAEAAATAAAVDAAKLDGGGRPRRRDDHRDRPRRRGDDRQSQSRRAGRAAAGERRDADRQRRRRHAHRHRGAAAGRLHADAADRPRPRTSALTAPELRLPASPAAPTTATTSATSARDTRLPRGQRPLRARAARRSSRCRPACSHNVGWNRLGGWRLWLEDTRRQLVLLRAPLGLLADRDRRRAASARATSSASSATRATPQGGADPPALRDPPGGQVGRSAVRLPAGLAGSSQPVRRHPAREPPPVAAAQLGSTDISSASGLDTAAVLAVASGAPVDAGLGAPSASRRRRPPSCSRATSDTMTLADQPSTVLREGARARLPRAASSTHARLLGARRALGRGHGAAAGAARARSSATRRCASSPSEAAQRADDGTIKLQLRTARRLPARGRRDEPRRRAAPSASRRSRAARSPARSARPARMGLGRNLTPEEISEQLLRAGAPAARRAGRAHLERRDDGHGRAVPQLRQRARRDPRRSTRPTASASARARSRSRRPAGSRASTGSPRSRCRSSSRSRCTRPTTSCARS